MRMPPGAPINLELREAIATLAKADRALDSFSLAYSQNPTQAMAKSFGAAELELRLAVKAVVLAYGDSQVVGFEVSP